MDWITLLIEAIGIAIACVFIVLPAREFSEIFRRLRAERGGSIGGGDGGGDDDADTAPGGGGAKGGRA